MIGMSLVWFVTGGFMIIVAVLAGWALATAGGPWWLAPVLAIPIGPTTAALAVVARRCAADLGVSRDHYFAGLRAYWRPALGLSAIGMLVLVLLLLNIMFYATLSGFVQMMVAIWVYLFFFWLSVQLYAYSILVRMEKPQIWGAVRTAAFASWANPLFSFLLLVIAAALTGVSIATTILVFFMWPALMALLGEHSFRLFLERAGVKEEE